MSRAKAQLYRQIVSHTSGGKDGEIHVKANRQMISQGIKLIALGEYILDIWIPIIDMQY
jgi:hypothetical protein